jgi:hypothetical protein
MDTNLLPQHKRLAMGLPVNNPPAGASKNMTGDMVKPHKSYGIHKNLSGKSDRGAPSNLASFKPKE